jgi:hypothetical protein
LLPDWSSTLIVEIIFETRMFRDAAISLSAFQNAFSRVTLVLLPPIQIDRLAISDRFRAPRRCCGFVSRRAP